MRSLRANTRHSTPELCSSLLPYLVPSSQTTLCDYYAIMRRMPSAEYNTNTFVLVLIGAANLFLVFVVFQLLLACHQRQGGDVELKAAIATLRQATGQTLCGMPKRRLMQQRQNLYNYFLLCRTPWRQPRHNVLQLNRVEKVLDKLDARFNASGRLAKNYPVPNPPGKWRRHNIMISLNQRQQYVWVKSALVAVCISMLSMMAPNLFAM